MSCLKKYSQKASRYHFWAFWLKMFMLGSTLMLLTGCFFPRVPISTNNRPTPTLIPVTPIVQSGPTIQLSPQRGSVNTQITVEGEGWLPGQSITIFLTDPTNASLGRHGVAAVGVKSDGRFAIAFVYPDSGGWPLANGILVVAQETNNEQGQEASAVFLVVPTTPTPVPTPVNSTSNSNATVSQDVAPIVTTSALNLRQGPSVQYPIIDVLYQGTVFTVIGQDSSGSWLYVRLNNGAYGWIVRSFTNFSSAAPLVSIPATPIPNPTATPLPAALIITDWRGEYWTNRNMQGNPRLTRNDVNLDFQWGTGSPDSVIPVDNFSARWSRQITLDRGTYRFNAIVDDGVRLWVDGQLIIDHWYDSSPHRVSGDISLAGGAHDLRVDYYDHTDGARIQVWWELLAPASFPNWQATYWSNRYFEGDPVLVRDDRNIDFQWGQNAPAPGVPADNFSARWLRWVDFRSGNYRFQMRSDDGIRFYLDGKLVLDNWKDGDGHNVYTINQNLEGPHYIQVDYYERQGEAQIRFWWERTGDQTAATPMPTNTASPTPTLQPTSTPVPLATETPVVAPTATATVEPTATATATATAEATATETATVEPAPATIAMNPSGGEPSAIVALTATGFPAGVGVGVYLSSADQAMTTTPYATSIIDTQGQANLSFTIPSQWPDGTPITAGEVTVTVKTDDGVNQAVAAFNFTPAP